MAGTHKRIKRKLGICAAGDVHTNTVESSFALLKRANMGTRHKVSAKPLQTYCNEMTFRFHRRNSSHIFNDTLSHMINAPTLSFAKLIKEQAA